MILLYHKALFIHIGILKYIHHQGKTSKELEKTLPFSIWRPYIQLTIITTKKNILTIN